MSQRQINNYNFVFMSELSAHKKLTDVSEQRTLTKLISRFVFMSLE